MTIPSIKSAGPVVPATSDTPAAPTPARQAGLAPLVEIDERTQLPVPPRFPWLSRLSQQLESAAPQRPAFPSAPVLGDHLDRSA
jgi:hypothetical protein